MGSRFFRPKREAEHKINELITATHVRLVADGIEPKIVSIEEALTIAGEQGLDLVEIAANAEPPVCKVVDYQNRRLLLADDGVEQSFQLDEKKNQVTRREGEAQHPEVGRADVSVKHGRESKSAEASALESVSVFVDRSAWPGRNRGGR